MRQLSGALRGPGRFEINTSPGVDVFATSGFTIAVFRHMSGTESARMLLDEYRRVGVRAIEERADDTAVVLFDEAARTLVLARDFVGMTPLYYAANKADIAFGSRIVDVIEGFPTRVAPDRDALVRLLVYYDGPMPGTTYFKDIFALPPGYVLVKRDAHMSISRNRLLPAPEVARGFEDAAPAFGRLFEQAVARRMAENGKSAVFVSGGLDSAALLCVAARHGDVVGINYGVADDPAADESGYLQALESSGIRVERVPFYPSIDPESAVQSVLESEIPSVEMVPLTHARAAARAVDLDAKTVMMGTWGDQVLAPFPPPHLQTVAPWRVSELATAYQLYMSDVSVKDIARVMRRQALRHWTPDWVLQRRRERLRNRTIFDELGRSAAGFGEVPRIRDYRDAVIANFSNPSAQTGIETNTKWGAANRIDARLPFLDRELLHFLLTTPDAVAYHAHGLKPLLRESMKNIVPNDVLQRRDKGDYTAAMRKHSLPPNTVLDMLDGLRRPVSLGFMSRSAARKTLARIEQSPNIWDAADGAVAVFGLDIWLRLFIEK